MPPACTSWSPSVQGAPWPRWGASTRPDRGGRRSSHVSGSGRGASPPSASEGFAGPDACWRSPMPDQDLVKTGVKGLDPVLGGGIPRGNLILVEGAAGTGKTTLGVEFVYRGAHEFDEPGLIVLFEVSPDRIIREAAQFGWDLGALEREGRLKILFTTRKVFEQELQQADSLMLEEAREIGARRIFVDSF